MEFVARLELPWHGLRFSSSRRIVLAAWMIVAAVLCSLVIAQDEATKKTRSWTLWHRLLVTGEAAAIPQDFSSLQWTVRGTVRLTAASGDDAAEIEMSPPEQEAIPESLVQDIQTLDGRVGKSWYQLKLVDASEETNDGGMVLTSVPACHIVRSKFRDELLVHLQPGTGHAVSLTYMPLTSPWAPHSCADMPVNTTLQWDTKVSWDTAVPGMVVGQPPLIDPITQQVMAGSKVKAPPGILWSPGAIPKKPNAAGSGKDEDGENKTADPFAFFKRYWYIFLPMLLMNMMAGGQPSEAPAATGAAATGAAAGGAARQRRGKKD